MELPAKYALVIGLMCLFVTSSHAKAHGYSSSVAQYIAENIDLRVTNIDNLAKNDVFHQNIEIINNGRQIITRGDWAIYLCFIRMMEPGVLPNPEGAPLGTTGLRAYHINGCLFKIAPSDQFVGLPPGILLSIPVVGSHWVASQTDNMPNWYVVDEKADPYTAHTIRATVGEHLPFLQQFSEPKAWKRAPADTYDPPTAQQRHEEYKKTVSSLQPDIPIIPRPMETSIDGMMRFKATGWVVIASDDFKNEARHLAAQLGTFVVDWKQAPKDRFIKFTKTAKNLPAGCAQTDEAYSLAIGPVEGLDQIQISASGNAGAYYAVQTLQMLAEGELSLPTGRITDCPRFGYRGLMLDVSRNFMEKSTVLKIILMMARYKLNRLHLHLTDDEGWRLEIPSLPELTQMGARRCHDPTETKCIMPQLGSDATKPDQGSGFYTVEDYQEILKYATSHHVEVIPEFDMPGHAHAAIKAMEARYKTSPDVDYRLNDPNDKSEYLSVQMFNDDALNPCISSTYNFITVVLDDLVAMHKDIQPLKVFHFGGDEVAHGAWVKSPACLELVAEIRGTHENDDGQIRDTVKTYFTEKVAKKVSELGLELGAWEDGIMDHDVPFPRDMFPQKDVLTYAWSNIWEWGHGSRAYVLANAGYQVVLSHATHLYFDHPYEPDPQERGYYWATRYIDTAKTFSYIPDDMYENMGVDGFGRPLDREHICKSFGCPKLEKPENIMGMQSQIWTESVRTSDQVMGMLFPRLLAAAERSWHKASWESETDPETRDQMREADWQRFAAIVSQKELAVMEDEGVVYHMRPPGARMSEDDSTLSALSEFPGQPVMESLDGGQSWQPYEPNASYPPASTITLASSTLDGTRRGRPAEIRT